jgi:hypothetical protein
MLSRWHCFRTLEQLQELLVRESVPVLGKSRQPTTAGRALEAEPTFAVLSKEIFGSRLGMDGRAHDGPDFPGRSILVYNVANRHRPFSRISEIALIKGKPRAVGPIVLATGEGVKSRLFF